MNNSNDKRNPCWQIYDEEDDDDDDDDSIMYVCM